MSVIVVVVVVDAGGSEEGDMMLTTTPNTTNDTTKLRLTEYACVRERGRTGQDRETLKWVFCC